MRLVGFFLILFALTGVACSSGASPDPDVRIEVVQPTLPPAPTNVPSGTTSSGAVAPTAGRWIDVDVTSYRVRLMDGTRTLQTITPVAVGAQVDSGAYESTQTGLYHVHNKIRDLQYDAPYKTYISHWVGFDASKANGFHSFLKNERGEIVDASTGRVSNGCIRTGDAEAIFAFAEDGMSVFVHF